MQFSNHGLEPALDWQSYQWQVYKQLELIPDAIPNPHKTSIAFTFGLGWAWKKLLQLATSELIEEQQVKYLKCCWAINEPKQDETSSPGLFRLWLLME